MIRAKRLLLNGQGFLKDRLRLLILLLLPVENGQVVQRASSMGVIVPDHLAIDRDRLLVRSLGLLILALFPEKQPKIVQRVGCQIMFTASNLLTQRQGLPEKCLR